VSSTTHNIYANDSLNAYVTQTREKLDVQGHEALNASRQLQ